MSVTRTVTATDVGRVITGRVSATNTGGTSATATSPGLTGQSATPPPSLPVAHHRDHRHVSHHCRHPLRGLHHRRHHQVRYHRSVVTSATTTRLVTTVPAGVAGDQVVTVENTNGTGTAGQTFAVVDPRSGRSGPPLPEPERS